ncbi:MAG TPA: anti-sigma factor [Acidimicrobiia bacterium]|nr:anti-sigma factor [Acidimicrobiia bacterium]
MSVDEVRDLIPLYALDALEGDEQIAVQSHLPGCGECRTDLARQEATVAELIPEEGPATGVWQRIVDQIDLLEADGPVSIDRGPRRSRGLKWLATVAAGAALVLATGVVAQRLADQPLSGSQAVLAAAGVAATGEGAVVAELVGDAGTVARVVLTAEGEGFVLPAGLDPLGPDRTYQLWVITADDLVISAGVLGADPAPARFTWSGEVAGFALTREVAGGVVSSAGDVVAAVET